ncbi:hypothetical protein AVEN_213832-1 [Araneus ventricosus]|uniref:Uncharacterized protein n=1 Tax=Araneus ventricosus TaxID=182803 RepID=A0A4Y2JZI3_ARAVE|nr:hypothetical protein AVEN_213832-1 [Araneus ventricosus]
MRARLHPQPSSIAQEGHELSQGAEYATGPGHHTQGSPGNQFEPKNDTNSRQTLTKTNGSPTGTPGTKNRCKEPGSYGPILFPKESDRAADRAACHNVGGHSHYGTGFCTRVMRIHK